MKPVTFSRHALDQMRERGAGQDEVEAAITDGESAPARAGRLAFRLNFPYNSYWGGTFYATKQVMPIVADEPERYVVVTVYVFYF
ncbi:MAG: hypothetical protein Kow0074_18100 [Candidatus Zixiibacteriota bacterium]